MKQGLSEIVIVLDRSGSMSGTKTDAEGGLREFIEKQRLLPGDCRVTFYRFDDEIERVFEDKPLHEVRNEELKLEPRNSTALLDAMNRAIDEVGARLARRADYDRPEHIYFITITDGYENASMTSRDTVFQKVTRQRKDYKWEFIFIGANQDAIAVGASLGIGAGQSISYAASHIGTQNSYKALNNTISRSRLTSEVACFMAEDRSSAMESDNK